MSNKDNLINLNDRSADEAREIRAAGGRAAAKARTRNNKLRDRLSYMMKQNSGDSTELIRQSYMGDQTITTDGTYYDKMCAALIRKACKGDMKAIELVLETMSDAE